MKTISLRQPWAYLICSGIKDIENRTWKLPEKYKGQRVLIHASTHIRKSTKDLLNEEQFDVILGLSDLNKEKYFNGRQVERAIIGSVEIVDCVLNHPSIWAEKPNHDYGAICHKNKCEQFVEWDFGHGICKSCKLVGQSYIVDTVPPDCIYKKYMPKPTYNWVLANPTLFDKPILNVKGKLGFWDYDLPEEYETLLK